MRRARQHFEAGWQRQTSNRKPSDSWHVRKQYDMPTPLSPLPCCTCFRYITYMFFTKKGNVPGPEVEQIRGIMDVDGATCTSCVYTIEHVGSKLEGVYQCEVNRKTSQIELLYDGNPETLDRVKELVSRIGYTAEVNSARV